MVYIVRFVSTSGALVSGAGGRRSILCCPVTGFTKVFFPTTGRIARRCVLGGWYGGGGPVGVWEGSHEEDVGVTSLQEYVRVSLEGSLVGVSFTLSHREETDQGNY